MNAWASPWDSTPSLPILGEARHAAGLIQPPSVLLGNLANDAKWGEDDDEYSADPGSSVLGSNETEESTAYAGREIALQIDTSALWATTATRQTTTSIGERGSKETPIVEAEHYEGILIEAVGESRETTPKTPNSTWKESDAVFLGAEELENSSIYLKDGTAIETLVEVASKFASAEPKPSPSIRSHCELKSPETPRTSIEDEDPTYSPGKDEISPAADGKEEVTVEVSGPGNDDDFGVFESARNAETPEASSPLSATLDPTEKSSLENNVTELVPEEHLDSPEIVVGVVANYEIKLKSESADDSEHRPVTIVSEISSTNAVSLLNHREQNQPVVEQFKSADDFIEQFLAGQGIEQKKGPDTIDCATSTRVTFAVDLPTTLNLLPMSSEIEAAPEPDTTIISSTSERKIWYRISRTGTVKEHNTDDIDNYVRVTWSGSAIRARVIETVGRWANQDRSNGGITMFGNSTGRPGIGFGWTEPESQKSVDYNSQAAATQGHAAGLSGASLSSALPSSPPIVLKTRFSWTSPPPTNSSPQSKPIPSTPNPNLSVPDSPESKPDHFKSPALRPVPSQHVLHETVGSIIPDEPWGSFAQFDPPPSPPTSIPKLSQTQLKLSPPKAPHLTRENHREPSPQTDLSPSPRSGTSNLPLTQTPAMQLHTDHKPRSPSSDSSTSFSSFTASTEPQRPETADMEIVNSVVAGFSDLSYMLRR